MSQLQKSPTSTSGAKKKPRTDSYSAATFSGPMINYPYRTILGIVAPQLSKEIHIDPAMMGIIFSAFAWTLCAGADPRRDVFRTALATN